MSNIDTVIKEMEDYANAPGAYIQYGYSSYATVISTARLERWLALLRDEKRQIDLPFSAKEEDTHAE